MKEFRILLVEDEPNLSELIARMLQRQGHYVIASVTTGETALQLTPHLIPNLIVSEVFLAGDVDGITLADNAASRFGIPSVIISSETMDCLAQLDESIRHHTFLRKPFSSEQLAEAALRACNREAAPDSSEGLPQNGKPRQTENSNGSS